MRQKQNTFLLLVADEDNGRFVIEGPMGDDQSWVSEIRRAQKAGRCLTCRVLDGDSEEAVASARRSEEMAGRTWWPPGSIISPEYENSASSKWPDLPKWPLLMQPRPA